MISGGGKKPGCISVPGVPGAEGEWYFEKYSTLSYAMGFNIIAYALTH